VRSICFENCSLLDTQAGVIRADQHLLVEGDRIVRVSDRPLRAPGAQRVDVGGRTLMPGLIDAHVHVTITTLNLAAMERKPVTLVMHESRRILERMLARGPLQRRIMRNLKVYAGPEHPHEAQKPEVLDVAKLNSKNTRV